MQKVSALRLSNKIKYDLLHCLTQFLWIETANSIGWCC